jgi:hypothetical protein
MFLAANNAVTEQFADYVHTTGSSAFTYIIGEQTMRI